MIRGLPCFQNFKNKAAFFKKMKRGFVMCYGNCKVQELPGNTTTFAYFRVELVEKLVYSLCPSH